MMPDQLRHVLLGLFGLSTGATTTLTTDTVNRPVLRLQQIDIMLRRLIEALAPVQVAQFEQQPTTPAAEVGHPATRMISPDRAAELVGEVEALLSSCALDPAALQRIAQTVDNISLLEAAIRLKHLTDVSITLQHPNFFDYVAELRFHSPTRRGHVIIVGHLHQDTLQVNGFADIPILQQIDLTYRKDRACPVLAFHTLEVKFRDKGIEFRDQWSTEARPESDLFVFQRRTSHPALRIETRTLKDPLSIDLGALRITLPVFDNCSLVATSFISMAQSAVSIQQPFITYIRAY